MEVRDLQRRIPRPWRSHHRRALEEEWVADACDWVVSRGWVMVVVGDRMPEHMAARAMLVVLAVMIRRELPL